MIKSVMNIGLHFPVITIKPSPGQEGSTAIISPFAAGIPAFISLETLAALTGTEHDF